jgi:hypothetical protein
MAVSGRTRRVYLTKVKGGVTTYPWIAGETSNSLDISREVFGGGDKSKSWDSFFAGKGNWNGSASFNLSNKASDEQIGLLTSLKAGDKVVVFVGDLVETAKNVFSLSDGIGGEAYITSISETNSDGSVSSRDISFQGDGEPSYTAAQVEYTPEG